MKPIPVVFVTTVFEEVREGPAIYARYLYEYFTQCKDVDFHLVTTSVSKALPNVYEAGTGKSSYETYSKVQSKALEVARSLGGCAIVHGNNAHTLWKFKKYDGPVVAQVNDYDNAQILVNIGWYARRRMLRRFLVLIWRYLNERAFMRFGEKVICNSHYTRSALESAYKVDNEKLDVIYKAVDVEQFIQPESEAVTPGRLMQPASRLIFVGTNWRRKGLVDLIDAFLLCEKKGYRFSLDIVGPNEDELPGDLLEKIGHARSSADIVISGRVGRKELAEHFWSADIAVLPSHHEALGVAILEALAAGVPVVATRVGGIPEILADSNAGIMVEPGMPDQIAQALIALADDPAKLMEMKKSSVARAGDFSREKMLQKVEQLYRSIYASREAGYA